MRKFAPLYSMAEDADGEGAGGGGESSTETFTAAQVQAEIEKAVSGLKTKNQELLKDIKQTKESLKPWEGLDPNSVRGMMERLEKDEELKLLAEGKTEEAWNKRLEKVSAKHKSELERINSEATNYKSELERANEQIRDLVIDQNVTSAFITEKGLESAIPDVVLRAKTAFKIEDGVPIARDKDGEIIRGKDGPITINEWVSSLKESAPHLFPGSAGAGATGSTGRGGASGIEARMERAVAEGDMQTYRKLRKQLQEAG